MAARRRNNNTQTAWSVPPSAFGNLILDELHDKYRAIGMDIHGEITKLAPTDTGTLKNNTHISIGQPDTRYIVRPREKQDEVKAFFGGDQTLKITAIPKGQFPTIYIQNNLPYAEAIENGHSKQSPQGFFALGFQAALVKHS